MQSLGLFGLNACLLRLLASLRFGFRVGASLGLAFFRRLLFSGDSRLSILFGLLFRGHDASFFGRLYNVA